MGLISGRGNLRGGSAVPLATALINDDLVLIASGRGVLEQALDVSQIDELNQAASQPLQQAVVRLGQGVALLTARPQAMEQWLGLPTPDAEAIELVAALAPAGAGVSVDALTQLRDPLPALPPLPADLAQQLQTPATSLALLSQPAQLLDADGANPWARLLGPLLQRALATASGPLPQLVAAADAGALLWADQPEGWLLATRPDQPSLEQLQADLDQQGFSLSPLESKGLSVQAWTRLQSRPVKGNPDQLQAQLAGARTQERGWAWWGQGLAVLNQQHEGRDLPQERLDQLQALAAPAAPLQWSMDGTTAQGLLRRWQPWRLLNTLASTPLTPSVEGAALSLEPDGADRRSLRLRGSLQLRS
jgi:hypothetical protein